MNSDNSTKWTQTAKFALWVAVGVLGAIFIWSIISAVLAAISQGEYWASRTGPVGDTFGGILGPILNAAVLATTVWVAVVWQPGQDRERRRAEESARDAEGKLNRASDVVGWVAETEDQSYYGVVVTNDADSLVRMVDIKIQVNHAPEFTLRPDREESLPRGTWFIPFATRNGALKPEWMLPVPVRATSGMLVELSKPATEEGLGAVSELYLRPHVRETYLGIDQPFFALDLFRYELHGQAWERTMEGQPQHTTVDEKERLDYDRYSRTVRASARTRADWRRVTPAVDRLVNYTLDLLRSDDVSALERSTDDLKEGIPVNQHVLPGVTRISRPQGGRLVLELERPVGTKIELWGKHLQYPDVSFTSTHEGSEVLFGSSKQASGVIRRAAAIALGFGSNAGDLIRDAESWLSSEQAKAQWFIALRTMVEKAAEATVGRKDVDAISVDES